LANKLSSAPSSKTLEKAITQPQSQSSIAVSHLKEEQGTTTRMDKYIRNMRAMNKRTAYEYYLRLTNFQEFVINTYKITLDNIIAKINEGAEDPYDILNGYVSYLQTNYNISAYTQPFVFFIIYLKFVYLEWTF
jgi:hypothetical protein